MAKKTICLWYDKDAEAAARFYADTFPDSAVGAVHRTASARERPLMHRRNAALSGR
jgi:predicted 3-demethylubiquinone-9 3-methyltransferase (glyoxalase superfamily)